MEIRIEAATPDDIDILVQIRMEVLRDVFELPADQDLEALKRANRAYYADALPSGGHVACLLWSEKEIVGCGGVCFSNEMPSPDNPTGRCAYLMNIYTKPTYRKKGIGGRIVAWLVDQAKRREITKIFLEATDEGRALYMNHGFKPMTNQMMLRNVND